MKRSRICRALLLLFLSSAVAAFAASPHKTAPHKTAAAKTRTMEVGVSAVGGLSVVGGGWRDGVDTFSESMGQDTSAALFPAFAASLFTRTPFGSHWCWGLSLGAGSWGGRVKSESDDSDERWSTIDAIGVEVFPSLGFRYPLGPGKIGGDLKAGFGALVTQLHMREAWSDASVTAEYDLDLGQRLYWLVGIDLSYDYPIGAYTIAGLLSADMGLASFDSASDGSVLGRFGLGVRLSRNLKYLKGRWKW